MAPPPGTGCVAFLAQGSLRNQILFKDLNVLQVCEKDGSLGQLVQQSSRFTGLNQHGYVFRDDFEDHKLNDDIWSEVRGGSVGRGAGKIIHGSALTFTTPDAAVHTHAMDLSRARQLQFALGTGNCPGEMKVELVYGRVSHDGQAKLLAPQDQSQLLTSEDQAQFLVSPKKYHTHGPVVSAYVGESGSGLGPDWDNNTIANLTSDDGWGSGETDNSTLDDVGYLSDQPAEGAPAELLLGADCSSWEPVHVFR
nr:uncharacterized protein LOC128690362 [Cherax quadricarinatus]